MKQSQECPSSPCLVPKAPRLPDKLGQIARLGLRPLPISAKDDDNIRASIDQSSIHLAQRIMTLTNGNANGSSKCQPALHAVQGGPVTTEECIPWLQRDLASAHDSSSVTALTISSATPARRQIPNGPTTRKLQSTSSSTMSVIDIAHAIDRR